MLVNEGPGYPLQRHTVPLNLFSAHTLCLLHTGVSRMNICIAQKCIFWWPYSSTLLNFYMITLVSHYTSHSARANIYFMKMLPFSLLHMIILNNITRATQAYYVCHDICLLHICSPGVSMQYMCVHCTWLQYKCILLYVKNTEHVHMITLHYVARAWCLDAFSLTHQRRARSAHACASLQCDDYHED